MPQVIAKKNGAWHYYPSLGEQEYGQYDLVFPCATPPPAFFTVDEQTGEWTAAEPPVVPPAPYEVSKVKLRLACRAAGLEALLDGYLAANPLVASIYRDAQVLMSDDAFFLDAVPALCAAANITEQQGWALIAQCQAD